MQSYMGAYTSIHLHMHSYTVICVHILSYIYIFILCANKTSGRASFVTISATTSDIRNAQLVTILGDSSIISGKAYGCIIIIIIIIITMIIIIII